MTATIVGNQAGAIGAVTVTGPTAQWNSLGTTLGNAATSEGSVTVRMDRGPDSATAGGRENRYLEPASDPSGAASAAPLAPAERETYSVSSGLAAFLGQHRLSVAISSYQSGKFYLLAQNADGGILIDERLHRNAMGICVLGRDQLALATLFQIIEFRNILDPGSLINNRYDACFVPRRTFITGDLDMHDLGRLADGPYIFVNTRYNCLSVPSERHSFAPVWKPPFISKIVGEDRCHLNGLAMDDGVPRYVTAVSRSDTIDGWRDRRADGGVIIDVASGEIVLGGLSMPHSPRLHQSKLWVLNSGTGEFGWVDRDAGRFNPVAFCPGFTRGLSLYGNYAFIGLSKPRHKRFEGLALDGRLQSADSEPWCGMQVIDLTTGCCVHWLRIDGPVTELYDLAVIPGAQRSMSLSFASREVLDLVTHEPLGSL